MKPASHSRRHFLQTTGLALVCLQSRASAAETSLIESIEKAVLPVAPPAKSAWFGPRACMVDKKALMTVQPIMGSDYFGPVQWATSDDFGKTWSPFKHSR